MESTDNRLYPVNVWRLWLVLALVYIALAAHLVYYIGIEGQCRSGSCLLLAASQIALILGVILVTIMFDRAWVGAVFQFVRRIPSILMYGIAAIVLFAFGLLARPEWAYAHMAIALAGLLALVLITSYGDQQPAWLRSGRAAIIGLVLVVIVVLIWRIRALTFNPSVHILDEPWTMGWAISYLRTGQPGDVIMQNVTGVPYYSLPRYYALVAAWFGVVGVGLYEGRLFSLLVVAVSITLTTFAARRLFDRTTAWLTLLVCTASSLAVIGLRLRHDVGVTFAIALSLYVHSLARTRDRLTLHALAGAAIGLGAVAHYHAIGLGVALFLGLYLPDVIDWVRRRAKFPASAAAFALSAGVIGGAILAWQLLPNFAQFFAVNGDRSARDLGDIFTSLVYHVSQIPAHSQIEFLLIVGAAIVVLISRTRVGLSIVLTLLLSYLALSVMANWRNGPFDYYSVPLIPLFGLLIAHALRLLTIGRSRVVVAAAALLVVPQLGYALSGSLPLGISPLNQDRPRAAQWVLENVPTDRTVIAEHLYFLWLYEYDFVSPLTIAYRTPPVTGDASVEEKQAAWLSFEPDVLIFDASLGTSGFLQPLNDPELLAREGFDLVYEDPRGQPVTIYVRSPAD